MPFVVEILCLGNDNYSTLGPAINLINNIQREFVFQEPPNRLKELGLAYGRREFLSIDAWDWMEDYRNKAGGQRPYLIAVIDKPLRSKRLSNLFGSHRATRGLAIFTLNDCERFTKSTVAYILYYFLRYSLSFISPKHKSHKITKGCFFDRKIYKRDLLQSFKTGELCDECQSLIQSDHNPEIVQSVKKISDEIKKLEFGEGKAEIPPSDTAENEKESDTVKSRLSKFKVLGFFSEWWFKSLAAGLTTMILIVIVKNINEGNHPLKIPFIAGIAVVLIMLYFNPKTRYARRFSAILTLFSGANIIPAFKGIISQKIQDESAIVKNFIEFIVEGPSWHFNLGAVALMVFLLWLDNKERSLIRE